MSVDKYIQTYTSMKDDSTDDVFDVGFVVIALVQTHWATTAVIKRAVRQKKISIGILR